VTVDRCDCTVLSRKVYQIAINTIQIHLLFRVHTIVCEFFWHWIITSKDVRRSADFSVSKDFDEGVHRSQSSLSRGRHVQSVQDLMVLQVMLVVPLQGKKT
jgi:hypothetical protein